GPASATRAARLNGPAAPDLLMLAAADVDGDWGMVRGRFLPVLPLVLWSALACAQQQQSVGMQVQQAIQHAVFYPRATRPTAEALCYMRQAQRLNFDPQGVIKDKYYKTIGFDDPRYVLLRAVQWWSLSKQDVKLSAVVASADAAALSITKEEWPAAIDGAKR